MHTFNAHNSKIYYAFFSPDGKFIVTASYDNTAKIWDVVSGQEITTLKGHNAWVTSASFTCDGKFIITVSNNYKVMIWRMPPIEFYHNQLLFSYDQENAKS